MQIDGDKYDFVENEADFKIVLAQIKNKYETLISC